MRIGKFKKYAHIYWRRVEINIYIQTQFVIFNVHTNTLKPICNERREQTKKHLIVLCVCVRIFTLDLTIPAYIKHAYMNGIRTMTEYSHDTRDGCFFFIPYIMYVVFIFTVVLLCCYSLWPLTNVYIYNSMLIFRMVQQTKHLHTCSHWKSVTNTHIKPHSERINWNIERENEY